MNLTFLAHTYNVLNFSVFSSKKFSSFLKESLSEEGREVESTSLKRCTEVVSGELMGTSGHMRCLRSSGFRINVTAKYQRLRATFDMRGY